MRVARVRVKARFEEKCFFYFRLVLIENLGSWYNNLYWLVKGTAEYMQTAIKYHLLLSLLLLEGPFCYASAE